MEAGEYGQTRGTRFTARRLELVAVTGLLWTPWCVFGGAGFFFVLFFLTILFLLRTHTACCKYEVTLPHLPLYQYYVAQPHVNSSTVQRHRARVYMIRSRHEVGAGK